MPAINVRLLRLLVPVVLALGLLALASSPDVSRAADDAVAVPVSSADAPNAGGPDEEDPALDADEPDDGTTGDDCDTKRLKQDDIDDIDDLEAEEPSDQDFVSCDDTTPGASAETVAAVLRFGRLDGGNVRITGPGEIEQVLRLGGPTNAKGSRMVLGRVGRKVTKAGKVHMTVVLTKAGKARLRRVKGTVTATLTTRVRVRGSRGRTTSRNVVLKGA